MYIGYSFQNNLSDVGAQDFAFRWLSKRLMLLDPEGCPRSCLQQTGELGPKILQGFLKMELQIDHESFRWSWKHYPLSILQGVDLRSCASLHSYLQCFITTFLCWAILGRRGEGRDLQNRLVTEWLTSRVPNLETPYWGPVCRSPVWPERHHSCVTRSEPPVTSQNPSPRPRLLSQKKILG